MSWRPYAGLNQKWNSPVLLDRTRRRRREGTRPQPPRPPDGLPLGQVGRLGWVTLLLSLPVPPPSLLKRRLVRSLQGRRLPSWTLYRPPSWSHEHDVAESAIPQTAAAWQPLLQREAQLGQAREHRRYRLRLLLHPRRPLPGRRHRQQG